MVKVIIQMDGEEERVVSGEFANVTVVSEAGNKYEAHDGIFGEISPDEVPNVLMQATVKTMKQAYEHLTVAECIGGMVEFYDLFSEAIMDEIVNNKAVLKEILDPESRPILEHAVRAREKKVRNGN